MWKKIELAIKNITKKKKKKECGKRQIETRSPFPDIVLCSSLNNCGSNLFENLLLRIWEENYLLLQLTYKYLCIFWI